ncbi:MAG: carbon starvation protein A [Planctomycetaceae bacterium]|nr:carbon starvation protein A [Planctomycetota bacterium]NUN53647.1 carbon starvation protein A [Planctomycetaceae bacterium]
MTLLPVGLGSVLFLLAGYLVYARLLARRLSLDASRATPAHAREDGVDFVPAKAPLLLAQHFSAISAAGPIAGPILAGLWFGWGPALAWILLGCVLIGAAHDFATLVASVRHRGLSVGEILRERLGRRAMAVYLSFVWIALVYVTIAFADMTAAAFTRPGSGGAVASSSVMYLLLALGLGVAFTRGRLGLLPAVAITMPLLAAVIWFGREIPLVLPGALAGGNPRLAWDLLLLAYCFVAALLPMPVLMQPRGFLGGFLLYGFLGAGVIGLLLGGVAVEQPAFVSWTSPKGAPLLPFLFVTIACGACSGFHGLVCSGTTSRQLDRETDAPAVGYGAMLLEGLIAVISLSTVMMLAPGDPLLGEGVEAIFASGIARFTEVIGVPREFGFAFGLLALTTFIYDTLDVCTRLGRYILQELLGLEGGRGRVVATLLTLLPAAGFLALAEEGAYMEVWGAFGTSNQLLAALTLLGVSVWLRAEGRSFWFVLAPAVFLLGMTGWSLALTVGGWGPGNRLMPAVSAVLLGLAGMLTIECGRAMIPNPARSSSGGSGSGS